MRVEADRGGSADILIAAAWSPHRLGSAMMRLYSEWDSAAKPRRVEPEAVIAFSRTLVGKTDLEKRAKAQQIVDDWYLHEAGRLFSRLKTLPEVRHQCILVLQKWGVEGAREVCPAVLLHWLQSKCPTCHGQKRTVIAGTPILSTKMCRPCQGTGEAATPSGEAGRRLETYLDDCVNRARASIGSRLRPNLRKQDLPGAR